MVHWRVKNFKDAYKDYHRFSELLKEEGDFLVTHPMETRDERKRFAWRALWWANRNNKVIKTETVWVRGDETMPSGKGIKVTLTRKYRYKK